MKPARKKKQRRLDPAAVERRFRKSEKFVRERQQKLIEEALAADKELPLLEAELLQKKKEFDAKYGRTEAPRARLPVVTEEKLIALGGSPRYEKTLEKGKPPPPVTAIVFGGENEARMIFKPAAGGRWNVDLEGTRSLEDMRRELNKAGRRLWDSVEQKPALACRAVLGLLSCRRQFKGVPWDEQPHFAAATMLDAIETTLDVLQQNQAGKLQLAFKLLSDNAQWPRTLDILRDDAWDLANELQRPPSKKELMNRFDPSGKLEQSEFSKLLKHAGLAWLRRDTNRLNLG